MRAAALVALIVVVSCSFDWDAFDPRIAASGGSEGVGGMHEGGGGNGPGAGASGGAGGCRDVCDGECVDFASDPMHCGDCTTECAPEQVCVASACRLPASCNELHAARPALGDGTYTLEPRGVVAFAAHCDMAIEGGGWTLVASAADNSYFAGTTCATACETTPGSVCDETPFTSAGEAGDVASMRMADHKSLAYESVAFDEMLFVDSNGQYASYEVSGDSVLSWYPAGLKNYVPEGTEAHTSFSYVPTATNIDPSLNGCGTLRVSFNVEDSDTTRSQGCHGSSKGPAWSHIDNDLCFWDDAGVAWTWSAFHSANNTSYRLWLVR